MNFRRPARLLLLGLALLAPLRAEVTLVNPTGEALATANILASDQFLGTRFVLTTALHVSSIGVTVGSANGRNLFAAIVALPDTEALPIPSPTSGLEKSAAVKFTTLFNPGQLKRVPRSATPITIPASVDLPAGAYAVVIGAGLFGSPGGGWPSSDAGGHQVGGAFADLQNHRLVPGSETVTWVDSLWHGTGFGNVTHCITLTGTPLAPTAGAGSAAPSAAPRARKLAPAVIGPTDSAGRAAEKIRGFRPSDLATTLAFQQACRDFCARFPKSPLYPEVRRMAAMYSNLNGFPEGGKVDGWDPTDAERDPKLNAEQRAEVAMMIAREGARAARERDPVGSNEDAEFDGIAAAVPRHRATAAARDELIRAALEVAPQKALPKLRELYPDDAEVAACIGLIENIGRPCEFQFTALDGRKVDSRDYLGKVVLLDFWAKDCAPCVGLMPELKKTAERYGPRGLAIVGVSLDDKRADAVSIVRQYALPWPQHFDGKSWKSALARRFLISVIPNGVLIDRQGNLRYVHNDMQDEYEMGKRIEALLAEQPAAAMEPAK